MFCPLFLQFSFFLFIQYEQVYENMIYLCTRILARFPHISLIALTRPDITTNAMSTTIINIVTFDTTIWRYPEIKIFKDNYFSIVILGTKSSYSLSMLLILYH